MATFTDNGSGGSSLSADAPIWGAVVGLNSAHRTGGYLVYDGYDWSGVELDSSAHSAEVTLVSTSDGNPYLAVCGPDAAGWFSSGIVESSGYALMMLPAAGYAEIRRNGSMVTNTFSAGTAEGDRWRIEHDGSGHVTAYRNDVEVTALAYTDGSPLTGTWVWLGGASGPHTFDDFEAADLGGGPAPTRSVSRLRRRPALTYR